MVYFRGGQMRRISKDITKHYQMAHVFYVLILPFFTAFLLHVCSTTKTSAKLD